MYGCTSQMARTQKNKATMGHLGMLKVSRSCSCYNPPCMLSSLLQQPQQQKVLNPSSGSSAAGPHACMQAKQAGTICSCYTSVQSATTVDIWPRLRVLIHPYPLVRGVTLQAKLAKLRRELLEPSGKGGGGGGGEGEQTHSCCWLGLGPSTVSCADSCCMLGFHDCLQPCRSSMQVATTQA